MKLSTTSAYAVDFLESERGWGSKIDNIEYYDTEIEAINRVSEYNKKHNPPGPAPDWYMLAMTPRELSGANSKNNHGNSTII